MDDALDGEDRHFLDDAFQKAFAEIEEGRRPRADDLLGGREHLRGRLEEVLRLAAAVAVGESRAIAPRLEGYTILGELGRGGMGSVFLARQERLAGRVVAVKVLPPALALSPRARQRFRSEVNAVAQLRHPNIVSIFDLVEDAGVHAFAMEWVDGTSLAEVIRRLAGAGRSPAMDDVRAVLRAPAGALRDATVTVFLCRVGIAIARALAAVHGEGFLHRDVKPSNVLLRRDGTPLLADFGLVREADSESASVTGRFVGTPAYAAPEQLRGERSIGPAADVYALGATLYHALALRLPHPEPGTAEILRSIEGQGAPPIRRAVRELPSDLETIVATAMDPDPSRRYASANLLADDLERLLALQPIAAKRAGLVSRAWKLARRNQRALAGALCGGALALAVANALFVFLFLVPRWFTERVAAARVALLDPEQANLLFILEFMRVHVDPRAAAISTEAAARALESYGVALRLRPGDEALRAESEAIRLALDLARARGERPAPGAALLRVAPLACDVASGWPAAGHAALPDAERLRAASPADLRLMGLVLFLTGEIDAATRAWAEFDRVSDPDPLVDGVLGLVFLVRDEAALAYPRLVRACEAFPGVGYLAVYLADAAVRCGDLARAGRLVEAARGMPHLDPMAGLDRVEADLVAARGETRLASSRYRSVGSGVSRFHWARSLERAGLARAAARRFADAARRMPRSERCALSFVRAADAWWDGVGAEERRRCVGRAIERAAPAERSFRAFLVAYRSARDLLAERGEPGFAAAAAPGAGSLGALADGLAVTDDARWSVWLDQPLWLRRLRHVAWESPDPATGSGVVDALWRVRLWVVSLVGRETRCCAAGGGRFEAIEGFPGGTGDCDVAALSADGGTVVGFADRGGRPWAFRRRATIEALEDPAERTVRCAATAVSADGSVVVGDRAWIDEYGGERQEAFRWHEGGGVRGLGTNPGADLSRATAVSPDGSRVYVGSKGSNQREASVWTESKGLVDLGFVGRLVEDVAADGETLVGEQWGASNRNAFEACFWRTGSPLELLGTLPGGDAGSGATDASRDAGVVVGWVRTSRGEEAMRWTTASGMTALGDLDGGAWRSRASVVAASGDLVGGYATSGFGREAVVWDAASRIERAVDHLARRGVGVPLGYLLTSVDGIAEHDGRVTLAGNAYGPSGRREGWVATFERR